MDGPLYSYLEEQILNAYQEKILNPYHPHTLYISGGGTGQYCNACHRQIPESFCYKCKQCKLKLHLKCALYEPTRVELHHFSHFHPLEPYNSNDVASLDHVPHCVVCNMSHEDGIPIIYGCKNCHFYVHKHCSEKLRQEIQHSCHQCCLTLRHTSKDKSVVLAYGCKDCKFRVKVNLDAENLNFKLGSRLTHFGHKHTLELTEENNENGDQISCSACEESCPTPCYGCIKCKFFLHQSCIDLPQQIQHYFHPCPLILHIQPKCFNCEACDRTIQGFYYYCKWCKFSMDVNCALLPSRRSECHEEQFCHISHGHPLTLTKTKDDDQFCCSVCRRCSSGPAFVCRKCNFFLDKSCFDLPRQIQYAFHRSHPLILQAKPSKFKSVCNVCCKKLTGLTYRCGFCNFEMHMQCTQPMPVISCKGHKHLLLFLENIDTEVECDGCSFHCRINHALDTESECKCYISTCDSCVFHCVECDFNLHLLCGPLPCIIQPECHHHPFVLTDSPLEDESDQFYCDVCEKERDPRLSVYNCKECLYPAEVTCVKSEVVLTLKGCFGGVDLRTLDGKISGKLFSNYEEYELKVIWSSLSILDDKLVFSEDDVRELKSVLTASRRDVAEASEVSREDIEVSHEDGEASCEDNEFSHEDIEVSHEDSEVSSEDIGAWLEEGEGSREDSEASSEDIEVSHEDGEASCEDNEVSHEDIEVSHEDRKVSSEDVDVLHEDGDVSCGDSEVSNEDIEFSRENIEDGEISHEESEVLNKYLEVSHEDGEFSSEDAEVPSSKDSEASLLSFSDLIIALSRVSAAPGRKIIKDSDEKLKLSQFDYRTYEHFMEKLGSSTVNSSLTFWAGTEGVVDIRDNWIPQKSAHIIQQLFAKYGDIGAESTLSPRVKNFFFVMLSAIIYDMSTTRIVDISANQLLNWWNNLKTLKFAGFQVQFAFDHLENISRAYFGLQVDQYEAELDRKMADLSVVINKSTRELKELKQQHECIASAKASYSCTIKDCLTEASTKKWQSASTGLL